MANDFNGIDFSKAAAPDIIKAALHPYGLDDPDLINGFYQQGKDNGGDAAYLWLRGTPQYKAAFPGMEIRAKNGLSPITEQQYTDWKSQMTATMRAAGIPSGFYDSPDDFATFIGNDVSPDEVQKRVSQGVQAAQMAPQAVKDQLFNFYGIDEGHLAAYYLDPNVQGQDLLTRKAALAVSQVGAGAQQGGYQLSRDEAETLNKYGVSGGQAAQGFGALTQGRELLNALPGETLQQMTRDEQLRYVEGDQQVQQELARRANVRKGQFAGGGGFSESAQGVSGLASNQ
jgi:hypothetical protein